MRLKSIKGSNQYVTRARDLDLYICQDCGRFNPAKYEDNKAGFPMRIVPKECHSCGSENIKLSYT